jgi:hypothetical protein
MSSDPEPDDTPAEAMPAPSLSCVSSPYVRMGCLHAGDPADWLSVTTPAACTAVEIQVRITFATAFEPVAIELWDLAANTMLASGGACTGTVPAAGDDESCLRMTVTPGKTYGIVAKPAGGGDCAGACNYNRYAMSVQLATPG